MRHNHTVIEKEEYYRSSTNETKAVKRKEVSKSIKEDLWLLKTQHRLSGTCVDKVIHLMHRSVQFSKENAEESTHWIPESSRSVLRQLESDIEDVFSKQITLSYNKTSYDVTFHYLNVREQLRSLLTSDIPRDHNYPEPRNGYREINSGRWWEEVCKNTFWSRTGYLPVGIILYTDGTTTGHFKGKTLKPIYMTLSNFSLRDRMKDESKRLIGFMPKIPGTHSSTKTISAKKAKRVMVHKVWQTVLSELYQSESISESRSSIISIHEGNKDVLYYPVICMLPLDHPEAQLTAGVKDSHKTACPCRVCFVPNQNLHYLRDYREFPDVNEPQLRTSALTLDDHSKGKENDFSQQPEISPFNECFVTQFDPMGVHGITPLCIMHTFLQGLAKYMLGFILELISDPEKALDCNVNSLQDPINIIPKKSRAEDIASEEDDEDDDLDINIFKDSQENDFRMQDPERVESIYLERCTTQPLQSVKKKNTVKQSQAKQKKSKPYNAKYQKFDERFTQLPVFAFDSEYCKRFKSGVSNLTFFTAMDLLAIVSQLPYVLVDNESKPMFERELRMKILSAVVAFLEILNRVTDCDRVWSESDIVELEDELLPTLEKTWFSVFGSCQKSAFRFLKWHMLRHIGLFIRRYGNPMNCDSSSFESFHKVAVKRPFQQFMGADSYIEKRLLQCALKTQHLNSVKYKKSTEDAPNNQKKILSSRQIAQIMHFENMIDPEQRNVTVNELLEYLKRIYEIILQESYPGQRFIQELQRIWPSEHWNIEKVRLLYERNDVAPLKRLRFSKGMKLPKSADWIRCESEYKGEKRYTPANISFLLTSLNPFRYDCVELRYDDAANVRWFGKLMLLIVHPYENTVVGCLIETYQDVYNYSLDSTSLSHVDTGSSKQSSRLRSLDKVDEDPDFVLQRKKKKQKTHKASEGQKKAREGEGKHRCTHGPEEMYRILKCPVVLELTGVIDLVAKEDILRRILLVPDFSSNLKKDGTWGRYFVDRFNHLTRKAFEIEEQF